MDLQPASRKLWRNSSDSTHLTNWSQDMPANARRPLNLKDHGTTHSTLHMYCVRADGRSNKKIFQKNMNSAYPTQPNPHPTIPNTSTVVLILTHEQESA